ncbi:hypothetical protein THAOC_01784 [Thalassiosira oceanica]|uniref:Uncharacterized protein n=1 Tax=Thalassiosira oceanica TaxID=159749 RepID=K0TGC0_THAOC|nr:hypothetical protein THAOC_01784 [Thalassiosira oceanica]|eukprot:EJK76450.1 hypothetical protein THAOC_01784 [Thalassiosira oceanica]
MEGSSAAHKSHKGDSCGHAAPRLVPQAAAPAAPARVQAQSLPPPLSSLSVPTYPPSFYPPPSAFSDGSPARPHPACPHHTSYYIPPHYDASGVAGGYGPSDELKIVLVGLGSVPPGHPPRRLAHLGGGERGTPGIRLPGEVNGGTPGIRRGRPHQTDAVFADWRVRPLLCSTRHSAARA